MLLAGLLLAAPATADTVHLTSGRSKSGIVLDEGDTTIRLETEQGTVGIPRASVASIEYASEDVNRDLRRTWAATTRQEERERDRRREERRARRAAEKAAEFGTVEVDGKRVSRAQADVLKERAARQEQMERRRVEAFRRAQQGMPEDERTTSALVVQSAQTKASESGLLVTAELFNVSAVRHQGIMVDVELIENVGQDSERIAGRRVVIIDDLPAGRIAPIEAEFPARPQRPVVPRLTVTSSQPVQ